MDDMLKFKNGYSILDCKVGDKVKFVEPGLYLGTLFTIKEVRETVIYVVSNTQGSHKWYPCRLELIKRRNLPGWF